MNDCMNLTSDYFPQLTPSLPRVEVKKYAMMGGTDNPTYHGSIAKGNDIYTFYGTRMYLNG